MTWLVADRFEVERRAIIQGGVEAAGVIEALDVVEDRTVGVGLGEEAMTEQVFQFERAPKRLHGGVVVAVGPPAHGSDQAMAGQSVAISRAGVLDTTVGVDHDTGSGLTGRDCSFAGAQSGWLFGFSILGSIVSATTFLALPAAAFVLDWRQLTVSLMVPLVAVVAVVVFIPFFRRNRLTSGFEHLGTASARPVSYSCN